MIPEGVLPKRLRLDYLKALLDRMPATETHFAATGVAILDTELRTHNEANAYLRVKPRWFSESRIDGTDSSRSPVPNTASAAMDERAEGSVRLRRNGVCHGGTGVDGTAHDFSAAYRSMPRTFDWHPGHGTVSGQPRVAWGSSGSTSSPTIGIVMSAFVQMDRDETLSLITDTDPGHIAWNFDLVSKVAVYVLLPLLILFASQFPGIGTSIADLFRSVPRVGPSIGGPRKAYDTAASL